MTPEERDNPKLIDTSRKKRISNGSGISLHDINIFIKQFEQMRQMMKGMSDMKDKMKHMPKNLNLSSMKDMAKAMNMMRKFK
jgi:signal recognition particle subunit SRP54